MKQVDILGNTMNSVFVASMLLQHSDLIFQNSFNQDCLDTGNVAFSFSISLSLLSQYLV